MKTEPDRFWKFLVDPAFLHRAAHLIDKESRGDFYDSYLERQVATHRRTATINDLVASLSAERYMPSAAAPINVPKSTYSQRPGTILPYRDRIVLQAIIMCLAPGLDAKLSSNVWSWRVRRNLRGKGPEAVGRRGIFRETDIAEFPFLKARTVSRYFETFEPWYALWPRFENATVEALKKSSYKYMVISDISGYFENIQISILEQLIHRNEPHSPRLINLLMSHLRAWQMATHDGLIVDRGIPQNNSVSSFLGNFYLKPVDDYFDRTFDRSDAIYFRYMDDIRILAKDRLTARRAALALESQIRRTKLNLQSAKTKILPSAQALSHIADSRVGTLESVRRSARLAKDDASKAVAIKQLNAVAKAKGDSHGALPVHGSHAPFSDLNLRVLRQWASVHDSLGSNVAVPRLIREALANPDYRVTRDVQRAARVFPNLTAPPRSIWDALRNRSVDFPYQRAELLIALRTFNKVPADAYTLCRGWCMDPTSDPYVRLQAALMICRLPGTWADAQNLFEMCIASPDPRVILAGIMVASTADRATLLSLMARAYDHGAPEAAQIVQYVRALRNDSDSRKALTSFVFSKNSASSEIFNYAPLIRFFATGSSDVAEEVKLLCKRRLTQKPMPKELKDFLEFIVGECDVSIAANGPAVGGVV